MLRNGETSTASQAVDTFPHGIVFTTSQTPSFAHYREHPPEGPRRVRVMATRERDALLVEVSDREPG
jgi:hypothetical protein